MASALDAGRESGCFQVKHRNRSEGERAVLEENNESRKRATVLTRISSGLNPAKKFRYISLFELIIPFESPTINQSVSS